MRRILLASFLILPPALLFNSVCQAQQECPQAPVVSLSHDANMFTDEMETALGDAVSARIGVSLKVIEDDAVTKHLRQIGERLVKQLPPSGMRFQFFLIDSPDANAFAIPGGRIYVTRKLITTTRTEDELAGVMAHELGHETAHDAAVDMTRLFREILEVDKLTGPGDVTEKYHRLLETYGRKRGVLRVEGREDRVQLRADQVGLYAAARAGYSPEAVADFWDHFSESRGQKGNWLSDMFGYTKPESKRLREMVKNLGKMPGACVSPVSGSRQDEFLVWQKAVMAYSGFGKKENLPYLESKIALTPWLVGEIHQLRFSPNGKYILAQDGASIFVLSRQPFASLFRIDAEDALPAQFTPDSGSVVFYTPGLRVEKWSIADQQQQQVDEVFSYRGCLQTALSPDGSVLACLQPGENTYFPLVISLLDVASGETIYTKKEFLGPTALSFWWLPLYDLIQASRGDIVPMAFSPDGRYFVAGRGDSHFAFDLSSRTAISLPASVRRITSFGFAFVGPDRLVGVAGDRGEHSALVSFPSGEEIALDIPIGQLRLSPAAHGDFVILRPLPTAPVGIMDLRARKVFLASKSDAIDIYDNNFVSERATGELGLYTVGTLQPEATIALPRRPLPRLRAAAVSPDLRLLALSLRSRGSIWDLASGERLFNLRGFRGAYFHGANVYADFAPTDEHAAVRLRDQSEKELRQAEGERAGDRLARLEIGTREIVETGSFQQKTTVAQDGAYLLALSAVEEDGPIGRNVRLDVRNVETGGILWSRVFPKEAPVLGGSINQETILLTWDLDSGAAKDEIKRDAALKEQVAAIKVTEGSYLVEDVDLRSGKTLAKFAVDTHQGSFRVGRGLVCGQHALLADNFNRILMYSLKGDLTARLFGTNPMISPGGELMSVEQEPGRLALYDTVSIVKRAEFTFPARVSFTSFSKDGKTLVVLTDDQTLYFLDAAKAAGQVGTAN